MSAEQDRDPVQLFWRWLDFVPECRPDDPDWKRWHARPGDVVDVVSSRKHDKPEVLGQFAVVAANPRFLKLADGRVFEQRGFPVFSGKNSPLRWRRLTPESERS